MEGGGRKEAGGGGGGRESLTVPLAIILSCLGEALSGAE